MKRHIRDDKLPSCGLLLKESETGYCVVGRGSCNDVDIVIPATHQEQPITSIENWAFYNDTSLKSINIHDNITSIGYYAFCGCTSLASITIPNSVTSIGDYALYGCTSLTSVTISSRVTDMGNGILINCDKLQKIHYDGTASDFYNLTKGQCVPPYIQLHLSDGDCTVGELEERFDKGDDTLE